MSGSEARHRPVRADHLELMEELRERINLVECSVFQPQKPEICLHTISFPHRL